MKNGDDGTERYRFRLNQGKTFENRMSFSNGIIDGPTINCHMAGIRTWYKRYGNNKAARDEMQNADNFEGIDTLLLILRISAFFHII